MGRVGCVVNHAIVLVCWLLCIVASTNGSEFPERECCDPIYPLIAEPEPFPPSNLPTTTIASSSSSYVAGAGGILPGRSGELRVKRQTSRAILHGLMIEHPRVVRSRILNFQSESSLSCFPSSININGH